jgi:AcrR family transcriptional regulator
MREVAAATKRSRRAAPAARQSAAQRRDALIDAAIVEFSRGGLHGTPVERISKRVGVTQPYVFGLFKTKKELFLAAVDRAFDRVEETFRSGARGDNPAERLAAMGEAYCELVVSDREWLLLQHQAYAASDDPVVRRRVRRRYDQLLDTIRELSGADEDAIESFVMLGMTLNVAAALGLEDFPRLERPLGQLADED